MAAVKRSSKSCRLRLKREPLSQRVGKGRQGPEECPQGVTYHRRGGTCVAVISRRTLRQPRSGARVVATSTNSRCCN
eukprot:1056863-Pleurochrysis_carterae.AAC.1